MTLIESAPNAIERCQPCDIAYSLVTKRFQFRWTDGTYIFVISEAEDLGTAIDRAIDEELRRVEKELRKKAGI